MVRSTDCDNDDEGDASANLLWADNTEGHGELGEVFDGHRSVVLKQKRLSAHMKLDWSIPKREWRHKQMTGGAWEKKRSALGN